MRSRAQPPNPRTKAAWSAAFVLFAIMMSHSVLETARDALFLSKRSVVDLGWAYVAIAVLALVALALMRHFAAKAGVRRILVETLGVAAVVTAIMAGVLRDADVVFAFYVWTGLIATLAVPLFWVVAGQGFSLAEAKRRFILIGAGASLGAAVGSAMAAGLAQVIPSRRLVAVGAGLLLVSSGIAALFLPQPLPTDDAPSPRRRPPKPTAFPETRSYLRWLGALGLFATMGLTLGDLAFKTVAAETIPPAELATFFGSFYAVLNLVALIAQLVIAPKILRFMGVAGAMLTLPVFVLIGGVGFALTGAFAGLLIMKVGDGGLRHSLHRVTSELLFLPLSAAVRERFKAGIDVLTQRGGQALAALVAFIAAEATPEPAFALACAAVVTTTVWLAIGLMARRRYLERFRETLKRGQIQRSATLPTLDLRSLEVVFEALGSLDEAQAIAALDLLAEQDRTRLVPSLVLFHPKAAVVQHALELLDPAERPDIVPAIDQLAAHAEPRIRAAALAVSQRPGALQAALLDPEPYVRATAAVVLGEPATTTLDALTRGSQEERRALAYAIGWLNARALVPRLDAMLIGADALTAREIAHAIERHPDPRHIVGLIAFLGDRDCRTDVRRALAAIGEPALRALVMAWADPTTPMDVRRHIPRTIQHFEPKAAMAALVDALDREDDGVTLYKILRALGRLRQAHPKVAIDTRRLEHYAATTATHAERMARWQMRLRDHFGTELPPSAAAMAKLIDERRRHALERILRVAGILESKEDFEAIARGLASADPERRDAGRELLDHHLPAELVAHMRAALAPDRAPPTGRALDAPPAPPRADDPAYIAFVAELLADASESLRCLAAYHVAELGLTPLRSTLEALRDEAPTSWLGRECRHALERLQAPEVMYAP